MNSIEEFHKKSDWLIAIRVRRLLLNIKLLIKVSILLSSSFRTKLQRQLGLHQWMFRYRSLATRPLVLELLSLGSETQRHSKNYENYSFILCFLKWNLHSCIVDVKASLNVLERKRTDLSKLRLLSFKDYFVWISPIVKKDVHVNSDVQRSWYFSPLMFIFFCKSDWRNNLIFDGHVNENWEHDRNDQENSSTAKGPSSATTCRSFRFKH